MSERTIFKKLHAVMQDMNGVPKRGEHTQKWKFMRADDVFDHARLSFLKHGVVVIPGVLPDTLTQYNGDKNKYETTMIRTHVTFTYTFVDIDNGDSFTTQWPGESSDYSDKGIQQAGTSSMKYMLMKMFMATPDHDPDSNAEPQTTTAPTAQQAKERLQNSPTRKLEGDSTAPVRADKIKYIAAGKQSYVMFNTPNKAKVYSRALLRDLGDDWKQWADDLTPDTDEASATAVELPAPVLVTSEKHTRKDDGEVYYTVTALEVAS